MVPLSKHHERYNSEFIECSLCKIAAANSSGEQREVWWRRVVHTQQVYTHNIAIISWWYSAGIEVVNGATDVHRVSHSCTQGVPLMYTGCPTRVHRVSHSCTRGVPLMYTGRPTHVHRVSHSCTQGVPLMYTGCPTHVHRVSHWCTQGVPLMYTGCPTHVHRVSHATLLQLIQPSVPTTSWCVV